MNLKPDYVVPKFLQELKQELISMGISGTIAGGACRDSIFGKEIADIDIFTWNTQSLVNIVKNTNFYSATIPLTPKYDGSDFQVVLNVLWKNYKIQFILIEPKEKYVDIVKDFPISISQVCLPILPSTVYLATELFYKSIKNSIIYYKLSSEPSNLKYLNKIMTKYANFPWEIIDSEYPEELWFKPPIPKIKIKPFLTKKYKVINIFPPLYREFNV